MGESVVIQLFQRQPNYAHNGLQSINGSNCHYCRLPTPSTISFSNSNAVSTATTLTLSVIQCIGYREVDLDCALRLARCWLSLLLKWVCLVGVDCLVGVGCLGGLGCFVGGDRPRGC